MSVNYQDVVDIISSVIMLYNTHTPAEAVGALQDFREEVLKGNVSDDTLDKVLKCKPVSDKDIQPLTNTQLNALEDLYPVVFREYTLGYYTTVTEKVIEELKKKFPELPCHDAVYISKGFNRSSKFYGGQPGSKTGSDEGDAWVHNMIADKVYVFNFYKDIVTSGVILNEEDQKAFLEFWENRASREAVVLPCGLEFCYGDDVDFVFRLDGSIVMPISEMAAYKIYCTIVRGW